MNSILTAGQLDSFIRNITFEPQVRENSNIVTLASDEITDILLKISSNLRTGISLDEILENTVTTIGESGIAERVLLFQIDAVGRKAILTHYWGSQHVPEFNPIGLQLELNEIPLVKLFPLTEKEVFQIENSSKLLSLPNYLFRNKFKALFLKLKTKSFIVTTGNSETIKLALNLQFSTREVAWSNEIEKLIKSITNQLATVIDRFSEKYKKENLQRNIIQLHENAIKKQEELLKQFASDLHDLPCSVIPKLKQAVKEKNFNQCEILLEELHRSLRQMINEYVIPDVGLLGFSNAIYQFINGFKKTFKGKVFVEIQNEEVNISQKKASELFKVIKEWFCNIDKHSQATEVNFALKKLNECYFLIIISDNGKGFDINDFKSFGYGISNIKKRLTELPSKFDIQSIQDKGSVLKIQFCVS